MLPLLLLLKHESFARATVILPRVRFIKSEKGEQNVRKSQSI